MTKVIQSLSKSQIKELIKAYIEFKKAEAHLKKLKEALTKDLVDGSYESDIGYVNKVTSTRTYIDTDKLFDEHPEINPEDYLKVRNVTTVNICNLKY